MRIVGPFIFIAVAIGLWFAAIVPGWRVVGLLDTQEQRVDEVLLQASRLQDTYERLYTQRASFSETDTERLMVMAPDIVDPVRFVMQMDAIAAQSNVTIENFAIPSTSRNASGANASTGIMPLSFRFSAQGIYPAIKDFLTKIETSLVVMDVHSLSLVPIESGEGEDALPNGTMNLTFTVDTYRFTGGLY
jgi:hypothetical protein